MNTFKYIYQEYKNKWDSFRSKKIVDGETKSKLKTRQNGPGLPDFSSTGPWFGSKTTVDKFNVRESVRWSYFIDLLFEKFRFAAGSLLPFHSSPPIFHKLYFLL